MDVHTSRHTRNILTEKLYSMHCLSWIFRFVGQCWIKLVYVSGIFGNKTSPVQESGIGHEQLGIGGCYYLCSVTFAWLLFSVSGHHMDVLSVLAPSSYS